MPGPPAPEDKDLAAQTPNSREAQPSPAVLIALSAGPQTLCEIEDVFRGFGHRLPHDPRPRQPGRSSGRLPEALAAELAAAIGRGGFALAALAALVEQGWLTGDDRLAVTRAGRKHLQHALRPR